MRRNYHRQVIFSAASALALLAASPAAHVVWGADKPPGSHPVRLTGTVTHSERLPPVPAELRPGRFFPASYIPPRHRAKTRQFVVPDWLAGRWQRDSATEVSRIELPSGRKAKPGGQKTARVTDSFGTYRDEHGVVWQVFTPARSVGHVDYGATLDIHNVDEYELAINEDESVLVTVRAIHTVIDKSTRRIVTVYQDEELNTYRQVAGGRLKTDSSVKVFDMDGKPFLLTRSVSDEHRLKPFEDHARQGIPGLPPH